MIKVINFLFISKRLLDYVWKLIMSSVFIFLCAFIGVSLIPSANESLANNILNAVWYFLIVAITVGYIYGLFHKPSLNNTK